MKFILIVIFINGGSTTAEFNNKEACNKAGITITNNTGDRFSCNYKGEGSFVAAARATRDEMFKFIREIKYGN